MTTTVEIAQGREHDAAIGERVHTLMWRNRLTQSDVAKAMGMSQSALSRKLRGDRPWTVGELYAVADVMGQTILAILGVDTPSNDPEGGAPVTQTPNASKPS